MLIYEIDVVFLTIRHFYSWFYVKKSKFAVKYLQMVTKFVFNVFMYIYVYIYKKIIITSLCDW
jgi:hypothetical protein